MIRSYCCSARYWEELSICAKCKEHCDTYDDDETIDREITEWLKKWVEEAYPILETEGDTSKYNRGIGALTYKKKKSTKKRRKPRRKQRRKPCKTVRECKKKLSSLKKKLKKLTKKKKKGSRKKNK